jgi:hypothetical protein
MIERETIDNMMQQALSFGYKLLTPSPDMYGGYECCIENLRTRTINVVMNCNSPIEAAQSALAQIAASIPQHEMA